MNTNEELIYKDEAYAIIGAAIEVYNRLGSGFVEAVYQGAMEIELGLRQIPFEPQKRLGVSYKGVLLNSAFVADLVCFGQIIVELKAIQQNGPREEKQLLNYLNASKMRLGLLINFGDPGRLDWFRRIN